MVYVFIYTNWGSIFSVLINVVGSDSYIVYIIILAPFLACAIFPFKWEQAVLVFERFNFFMVFLLVSVQILNVHILNY